VFFFLFLLILSFTVGIQSSVLLSYFFIKTLEFDKGKSFLKDNRKEKIEQTAVTVCEVLRDLRKKNNCYTGTPDDGWNWLGTPIVSGGYYIYSGDFNSLSLEPQANTFSCSQTDKFGRYLFFRGLNAQDYQGLSYWIKVPQKTTDPCGVGDFVEK